MIPRDLDCLPAFHRCPGRVRDNGYPSGGELVRTERRNFENIAHTGNCFSLARIEVGRLATECRASRDNGEQHVGHTHIETELRTPIDLCGDVDARRSVADELEIAFVLKFHLLGIG